MTLVLVASLFVLLALGVPVAFSMLLASTLYLLVEGNIPLIVVAQQLAVGTDKYLLLAIPFFFLAAEIMNSGGILDRLLNLANALVGHIRGGLGHVNVVSSMLFSGMSGSAVADAAGLGKIEMEMMRKAGYGRGFAAAITAASATMGPVIPPSIPLVVYGGIAEVSIGRLFLAGILPGLLMTAFLMAAVYHIALRRGYPKGRRTPLPDLALQFVASLPVLLVPVIILGGILSGVFTPTESSIVAAVYALVLSLVLRELELRRLWRILVKVGADTARLMLIVAAATLFGWILAREAVPQRLAAGMLAMSGEPWIILLMINLLLFALGCFMEPLSVMIVLVPVFMPLVGAIGIDPVHFGVVVTLNLMIGLITPPVGMVMFVLMDIARIPLEHFAREVVPFLLALIAVLALITYVPPIVLVLPDLVLGVR